MRINARLLVQEVDGDMVILDEHSGAEIVVPQGDVERVIGALNYLSGNTGPYVAASGRVLTDADLDELLAARLAELADP